MTSNSFLDKISTLTFKISSESQKSHGHGNFTSVASDTTIASASQTMLDDLRAEFNDEIGSDIKMLNTNDNIILTVDTRLWLKYE